jgi:hypothetical protein
LYTCSFIDDIIPVPGSDGVHPLHVEDKVEELLLEDELSSAPTEEAVPKCRDQGDTFLLFPHQSIALDLALDRPSIIGYFVWSNL